MLPAREKMEDVFALEVQGDSMIDAMVNDGDIVVMKKAQEARNGDMVASGCSTRMKPPSSTSLKKAQRCVCSPPTRPCSRSSSMIPAPCRSRGKFSWSFAACPPSRKLILQKGGCVVEGYYLDFKKFSMSLLQERICNSVLIPSHRILLENIDERFNCLALTASDHWMISSRRDQPPKSWRCSWMLAVYLKNISLSCCVTPGSIGLSLLSSARSRGLIQCLSIS